MWMDVVDLVCRNELLKSSPSKVQNGWSHLCGSKMGEDPPILFVSAGGWWKGDGFGAMDIVMLTTSGSTQNSGLNHDSLSGVAGCRCNLGHQP